MQEREAPVIIYESINGAKWDCEPRDEKRVRRKCASGAGGEEMQNATRQTSCKHARSSYSWNEKPVRWLAIL